MGFPVGCGLEPSNPNWSYCGEQPQASPAQMDLHGVGSLGLLRTEQLYQSPLHPVPGPVGQMTPVSSVMGGCVLCSRQEPRALPAYQLLGKSPIFLEHAPDKPGKATDCELYSPLGRGDIAPSASDCSVCPCPAAGLWEQGTRPSKGSWGSMGHW